MGLDGVAAELTACARLSARRIGAAEDGVLELRTAAFGVIVVDVDDDDIAALKNREGEHAAQTTRAGAAIELVVGLVVAARAVRKCEEVLRILE